MSKNLKLKKVIKSFVPEPISSVFGFLYVYEYYMNITNVVCICTLLIFISRPYFWTWICYSTAAILWGVASRISSKQDVVFLCSFHLPFSP